MKGRPEAFPVPSRPVATWEALPVIHHSPFRPFGLAIVAALAASCRGGHSPPRPAPVPPPPPTPAATARYSVSFEATWSAPTHPTDFPANAHFSPLIGATHSARVGFWQPGGPASPGIQAMAERGRTSPLDAEMDAAIA